MRGCVIGQRGGSESGDQGIWLNLYLNQLNYKPDKS